MKNKTLLGLLVALTLASGLKATAGDANLVDAIWDDTNKRFNYEWTVRANKQLTLDKNQISLSKTGTVGTNGNLLLGGYYHLTANGTTLTIKDNGGVAAGDRIKIVLGDGITLTSASGGQIRIASENGQKLNGAVSPLLMNGGSAVREIRAEYVGTTTGYRVSSY